MGSSTPWALILFAKAPGTSGLTVQENQIQLVDHTQGSFSFLSLRGGCEVGYQDSDADGNARECRWDFNMILPNTEQRCATHTPPHAWPPCWRVMAVWEMGLLSLILERMLVIDDFSKPLTIWASVSLQGSKLGTLNWSILSQDVFNSTTGCIEC